MISATQSYFEYGLRPYQVPVEVEYKPKPKNPKPYNFIKRKDAKKRDGRHK